ncbi:TetR/AcrR family transcriptional regulator [Streptomyces sp. DSM 44915]|uniref:TetR/AcrR family transcriptional regulator n=1 Tax=Streptomyces chisholmiae TaxID=3075540 RepID=A0ABU2JYX6_9ACTN|nr:TetR/AcrR family transcriptional regulator [Streptomyces sp. DSM 44915]MDT0270211.1 TetR/AcrR family transcriptional regulator [Streptomyces sp. DSM 44915]
MPGPPARRGSARAADRAEPRAVRTRARLVGALLDALTAKPLEALSVAEVCRRAEVHRVTFYSHWPDIRSLAAEVFAQSVDRLARVPDEVLSAAAVPADLAAAYERALHGQLREILDHRAAYRTLFTSDADAGFHRRLVAAQRDRAAAAIGELARLGVAAPGGAAGYPAAYIAGGVVAAFEAWALGDETDVAAAATEIAAQLPHWWPRPD